MDITAIQNGSYVDQNIGVQNIRDNNAPSPVHVSDQFKNSMESKASDNIREPATISPSATKQADLEKQFQSTIIGIMLKPLFVEMANSISGKGVEADVYTSLLTDAVSKSLAESGVLDIDKYFSGSGDQQINRLPK